MNPLALIPETTTHPLEPLSEAEVAAAATILKTERELDDGWRFVFIMLHEPPKDAVRAWRGGRDGVKVPREAEILLRDRTTRGTYEAAGSATSPDSMTSRKCSVIACWPSREVRSSASIRAP
jgi:primary-amine oxidase